MLSTMRRGDLPASPGTVVLFFDLAEIDEMDGVVAVLETVRKHPQNPLLPLGDKDAWDCAQASPWALRTVLYDDEERLFKCWHNGTDHRLHSPWYGGYAVSADGVEWEKPVLNVFEFEGNSRNNIFSDCPYGSVIKDTAEPDPERRYKMRVTESVRYSADGIRWGPWRELNVPATSPRPWDAVAFVRDDQDPDPERRYKFVYQYYDKLLKPGPEEARHKALVFGATEADWFPSPVKPMLGPNDGFEHENHFLMYIPYRGQYLCLYECGWYHPDGTGKYGRYVADIRLAHSRDGERFVRIHSDSAVIPTGGPGEWDGQFLVISDKAVIKDDILYLYYCGQGMDWASWPPGNMAPGDRTRHPETGKGATGNICLSRMGLATLPLDRFTSVRTRDRRSFGTMTTKPFQLEPDRPSDLVVNLSGGRRGWSWLTAEALHPDSRKPLPGFSAAECPPLTADSLRLPVRWDGKGIGEAALSVLRLRFHLYGDPRLHSFAFS